MGNGFGKGFLFGAAAAAMLLGGTAIRESIIKKENSALTIYAKNQLSKTINYMERNNGIKFSFEPIIRSEYSPRSGVIGFYISEDNTIILNSAYLQAQDDTSKNTIFGTMVHELSHAYLDQTRKALRTIRPKTLEEKIASITKPLTTKEKEIIYSGRLIDEGSATYMESLFAGPPKDQVRLSFQDGFLPDKYVQGDLSPYTKGYALVEPIFLSKGVCRAMTYFAMRPLQAQTWQEVIEYQEQALREDVPEENRCKDQEQFHHQTYY